jgi:hypothetical protein
LPLPSSKCRNDEGEKQEIAEESKKNM